MIGKLKDLTMNRDGSQNLTLTIQEDFREMYDKLDGANLNIEIKKASGRRSLEANAYLWHLCSEVAKASSQFAMDSKDDIYREAIRAKGEFEPLLIREDALEKFISRWSDKGTGWFTDIKDTYKDRYKVVHAYYGSSTYDSASMARVIDYVILKAEELGIPTITPAEEDRMLQRWGERYTKRNKTDEAEAS